MASITESILALLGGWVPLSSRCIAAVKWDPTINIVQLLGLDDGSIIGTLSVRFRDGSEHSYEVFLTTFLALIASGSPGRFFNSHIKR